jgi:oxygen-independent coproporphyrinogen III oxidase
MYSTPHLAELPSAELIGAFDRSGPRYTSYPTADRFVEAFDADAYARSLALCSVAGAHTATARLGLYVHIPFCANVCFYCACNKVITRQMPRAVEYLGYLKREIALHARLLGRRRVVSNLHLGGGTPTFLSDAMLADLMSCIKGHFDIDAEMECSIEVDPRTTPAERIARLGALGFNRISIGVQDFAPRVQHAVNRIQPEAITRATVAAARAAGFRSVNLDLIYGLPEQTLDSFAATIDTVLDIAPDRIALYSYAHLPQRFKPQRQIDGATLPSASVKLEIMLMALKRLTDAGYVAIGMDHFARPGDDLAEALARGCLQRNFQGYATHADTDLIGIGASAIGKTTTSYSQNHRDLPAYYAALDEGSIPIQRGIELSADDLLRRAVIMGLMCRFTTAKDAIESAYLIRFDQYFERELEDLAPMIEAGLVTVDSKYIEVTAKGRLLVRAIAMVFDRYLRESLERARYSRLI